MADVIGRGVIEVSADSTKLKAGIADATNSLKKLGKAAGDSMGEGAARASRSIDRYVRSLEIAAATHGKSSREAKLYELSLRGASAAQLASADAALKLSEAYARGDAIGAKLRAGLATLGTVAVIAAGAAVAAFDAIIKKAGEFQDIAEKAGDSAEAIASLAVAAGTSGKSMDEVGNAMTRLAKNLIGVDDESKAAGAAIKALGLSLEDIKKQRPSEQIENIAKAFNSFEDSPQKAAVAMALFGKAGADLLPFLKELGHEGGRQVILTQAQIEAADAYADTQAKLRTQLTLTAAGVATQLLPLMQGLSGVLKDVAGDQENVSIVADIMRGALKALIETMKPVVVVASDVAFVFAGVGREIGAIAAQLAALARMDFTGFSAISDAVKEDAERARKQLDEFQARILSIGTPQAQAAARDADAEREENMLREKSRRSLVFDGASKDKAAQIAKARLDAETSAIKSALSEQVNAYENAEKILEAQRTAGLLNEREYYAAKRAFIELNASAQVSSLEAENKRIAAEKTSGKEKIDNDRKIAENESKIAIIRASATANLVVLSRQEETAMTKIQRAYAEAEAAAKSYLDVLTETQNREIEGFGKGQRARDRDAARQQIIDRFQRQREQLESDNRRGAFDSDPKKYQEELDRIERFQAASLSSFEDYYARRTALEASFNLGAQEALQNYLDGANDIFMQTERLVTNAFQGMEDALVQFVMTGKLNFKQLADSIIADIARVIIKQQLARLAGLALNLLGSSGGVFSTPQAGFANGGVFASGGVVDGATQFRFSGNQLGVMGEAGPEGILPLKRGADGKLGVTANGVGAVTNVYNVQAGVTRSELVATLSLLSKQMEARMNQKLRRAGVS